MDAQAVKEICKKKWISEFGMDARTKKALDEFDAWIDQIPDVYKELSFTLVQNLEYFSEQHVNNLLVDLHKKLLDLLFKDIDYTIFAFIKSNDGKSNSSNDYWTMYKFLNEINKEFCYEDILRINNEQWEFVKNIVFVDDFCGTGKSFLKELSKNRSRYHNKNIYFVTICMMEDAILRIKEFSKKEKNNKINIIPLYHLKQKKTFSRNLFKNDSDAKKSLTTLTRLLKIPKIESPLGFGKSESLIAFYNNTPNNTLPIIRYDTEKYKSLFPREHECKPIWDTMRVNKKRRKIKNYNNKST